MKVGDKVRYITKGYETVEGIVTNIIGMGEDFKHPKLDLQIGRQVMTSVPHQSDIEENAEGKKNICYTTTTVTKSKKKETEKQED